MPVLSSFGCVPRSCLALLAGMALCGPVRAQTSPPPGNLQLPPRGHHEAQAAPPVLKAAPREPVHRAAPSHPRRRPPVVEAKKPVPPVHPAPGHPAQAAPPAPPPAAPAKPAEPPKGSATGLPLPRFASLRTDEVNLRAGPGGRYPIDWVYKRRELPVEIEREFDVWRLVQLPDGTKGWVHQATLVGRRSFIVTGAERTLRDSASDKAGAVALLKPGVIGLIRKCEAGSDWCQVQVQEYRGWLKRGEFWGTLPGEAVQ